LSQQYYIKSLDQAVLLEKTPFAAGGEGQLFYVVQPSSFRPFIAKLFHPHKRTSERAQKVAYLIKNPPRFTQGETQPLIVWPKYQLHDEDDNFVGYLMPKVSGKKLELLCAPTMPKNLNADWQHLQRDEDASLRLRLKVCYNLAIAIQTLHQTNQYILVDLKPDNILIQPNGLLSLVDIDSIEILEEGKTLFPAAVATPEYTPPEYYRGVKPGKQSVGTSWDSFSLAVIFYRLLFGVHPYAATAKAPYNQSNALGEKIKAGLFVHRPSLQEQFEVVPPPHKRFLSIDKKLQQLFFQTFDQGNAQPEKRPAAEDWAKVLGNHPLLLTNRPLPSSVVEKDKFNQRNWYKQAVEEALAERGLVAEVPIQKKIKKVVNHQEQDPVWTEALGYYNSIWRNLKTIGAYVGVALVSVLVVLVGYSLLGYGFDWVAMLWEWLVNLNLIGITITIIITLGILPLVAATFKDIWQKMTEQTQGLRQGVAQTLAFTDNQKRHNLEELKYALYSKRTKIKKQLRAMRSEANLLYLVKSKKENEFYKHNFPKIRTVEAEIGQQLHQQQDALADKDKKAQALMQEEAEAIQQCRQRFWQTLNGHPRFGSIKGEDLPQKLEHIELLLAEHQAKGNEGFQKELTTIVQQYRQEIKTIKEEFDQAHLTLQEKANDQKIAVETIVQESANTIRKKIKLDDNLLEEKYEKQLHRIKHYHQVIAEKEEEMTQLNEELDKVKKAISQYDLPDED